MANNSGAPRRRGLTRDIDPLSNITDPTVPAVRRNLFSSQLSRRPARGPARSPSTPDDATIMNDPFESNLRGSPVARPNRQQRRPLQPIADGDTRTSRREGAARRRPAVPPFPSLERDEFPIIERNSDGEYDLWEPPVGIGRRPGRRPAYKRNKRQMDGASDSSLSSDQDDTSDFDIDGTDFDVHETLAAQKHERKLTKKLSHDIKKYRRNPDDPKIDSADLLKRTREQLKKMMKRMDEDQWMFPPVRN